MKPKFVSTYLNNLASERRVIWCTEDSDESATEDKEVQTDQEAAVAPDIPVVVTPSSQYSARVPKEDNVAPPESEPSPRSLEECIQISKNVS